MYDRRDWDDICIKSLHLSEIYLRLNTVSQNYNFVQTSIEDMIQKLGCNRLHKSNTYHGLRNM